MEYDALAKYIPQIAQGTEERTKRRTEVVDHITKLLSNKTPTPVEVASIAQQTLTPYTRREIAAGVRRPTYHEAQAAARAATLKYDIDLLDIVDKGLDGAARDAQLVINAINASTNAGNQQAAKHKDVISSVTAGMDPTSQILFTREYLSRLAQTPGDVSGKQAWDLAANVVKSIDPKAKKPAGLPVFPRAILDEDGNQVQLGYNIDTGQYDVISVAPPKEAASPVNRLIPIVTKTTDPKGNVVETTRYEAIAPGRSGELPKHLGPIKVGAPGEILEGVKTAPPKVTMKESSDIASVRDSAIIAKKVHDKLITDDGSIDRALIASMYGKLPYTEGRQLAQELEQAVFNYIFIKSGQTVTEQERDRWLSIFMPSPFDDKDTVKSKLMRLDRFFSGATDFLPAWARKRIGYDGESSAAKPKQGMTPQQERILEQARKAIASGKDKSAVENRLREYGIDPGNL